MSHYSHVLELADPIQFTSYKSFSDTPINRCAFNCSILSSKLCFFYVHIGCSQVYECIHSVKDIEYCFDK